MQSDVFLTGEGDAYHQRNRHKYAAMVEKDPVLKAIEMAGLMPSTVLEIGCATGWRLAEIQKRYGAECHGVEPSRNAVREAMELYPHIRLFTGVLEQMYLSTESYDLIILSFVLHWVDRSKLLKLLAEIDRMLKIGGHLVISDFWPMGPKKVPYKHAEGIYTYKQQYSSILLATKMYQEVLAFFFNADTLEEGYFPATKQGCCEILQKGELYQLCE